jgi:NAD(P)-dependent dehydrogenase (short-subunit alcohol dehydrogenase family)
MPIDMTGKAALVTGAASGLGRAGQEETAALLGETEVLIHPADLADPDACTNAVVDAVARFGRLDALCNIAGIIRMAHTPEMPREHYLQTIAINLNAPWFLSQAAIPHLLETNGAIVNCASSAAMIGEAYAAAYCASKAGLVNMTKALAMEFARKPIRINAVAPGGMITNISQGMTFPSEAEMDLVARYSGLRGQVEVDDVADLIVLLASPAGRSYHGACISIDAGITAG